MCHTCDADSTQGILLLLETRPWSRGFFHSLHLQAFLMVLVMRLPVQLILKKTERVYAKGSRDHKGIKLMLQCEPLQSV